ncbi:MAG: tetratricopeptide repeat protein [Candidatus Rokubacteria bacterium]|nr:tetratricopeptide repeat protein [Candidatus Rokubacteria bacterium]
MNATIVVAFALGLPAAAFALWPLVRAGDARAGFLALPADAREQLAEQKRQILRALRELDFEHEAGHVSDADYAELRARHEGDAARVFAELDRLDPMPPAPAPAPVTARASAWRQPWLLAVSGTALVVFGVVLGAGIVRYTAPDTVDGNSRQGPTGAVSPMPGSRPLASGESPAGAGSGAPRTVTPEIMQGMLQAARSSLFAGRYNDAIAAYQAVLKRDPKNVDALTHLALIVAIGGHADTALETLDKALALDPNYPPALLYRGQILYDGKKDTAGAIKSWEKFVAVAPPGEERDRVSRLIADARAGTLRPR